MKYLMHVTIGILLSSMLLIAQAAYSADNTKIEIEGRVTKVSESAGIIEVNGEKFRFRYSTKVIDESTNKASKQAVKDIPKGTLVIIKARQEKPYPIVLTITPQLT